MRRNNQKPASTHDNIIVFSKVRGGEAEIWFL